MEYWVPLPTQLSYSSIVEAAKYANWNNSVTILIPEEEKEKPPILYKLVKASEEEQKQFETQYKLIYKVELLNELINKLENNQNDENLRNECKNLYNYLLENDFCFSEEYRILLNKINKLI